MKTLFLAIAAVVLAALAAPATAATTTYSTCAQLTAAYSKAAGGDSLVQAQGTTVLDCRPGKRTFSPPLNIDTTAGTIGGWYGGNGGGLNLKVGKVVPGVTYKLGLRFDNMADLVIDGTASSFDGPTSGGNAIMVLNGQRVKVIAPKVHGFTNGVSIGRSNLFAVAYVECVRVGADCIDYYNSQSGRIHHNWSHGNELLGAYHPDGIQGWSAAGAPQTRDVEVDHNRIEGHTQGIDFFDHPDQGQLGSTNLYVHDNVVTNTGYPWAFSITDGVNARFEDNQASTIAGSPYQATINLTNTTGTRTGNTVAAYTSSTGRVYKAITDPPVGPVALPLAAQ